MKSAFSQKYAEGENVESKQKILLLLNEHKEKKALKSQNHSVKSAFSFFSLTFFVKSGSP